MRSADTFCIGNEFHEPLTETFSAMVMRVVSFPSPASLRTRGRQPAAIQNPQIEPSPPTMKHPILQV